MRWNGNPSLRMFRIASSTNGASYSYEKSRGVFGSFYRSASDKPVKMTFSFYAKGDKAGNGVWVRLFGDKTLPPLTTEWKRYSITGDMGGGGEFLLCLEPGATVWISGLQMEDGETPTEFQDNSVIVIK